jgi:hypothetical protein
MKLIKDFESVDEQGMEMVVPAGTKLIPMSDEDRDPCLALDGFEEVMYHDGKGLVCLVMDADEYAEHVAEL